MARLPSFVLGVIALCACGGPSPLPDGGVDASIDAGHDGGVDAGTDAGPSWARYCSPCQRDADCGEGNVCMYLSDTQRACARPCATDADCDGLPLEASCEIEEDGLPLVCRPTAGTCIVSAPGSACDGACEGTYDRCLDLEGLGAACTTECVNDADCPLGMRRCRDTTSGRVCVPDEQAAPERCQAIADRFTTCADDSDCARGRCYGEGSLRLCLEGPSGGTCADGTVLEEGPSGEPVCVPSIPSTDPWSERIAGDCDCLLGDASAMLDEALARIGRDRCEMMFPHRYLDLFPAEIARDRFRLGFTDRVHAYWPGALRFGRHVASRLDAAELPGPLLREAAAWGDLAIDDAPRSSASSELEEALARMVEERGGTADRADIGTQVSALPSGLATRLVPVIDALRDAMSARDEAIAQLTSGELSSYFVGAAQLALDGGSRMDLSQLDVQGALLGDVDVAAMASAATRLLDAIEEARLSDFAGQDATLTVETPSGRIAIRGSGADTYDDASWHETALLVDLGGDDVYRMPAGATASTSHGVGVVIDLRGTDDYGYEPVADPYDVGPVGHRRLPSDGAGRAVPVDGRNGPFSLSTTSRQGAGRLGIGLLLDLGAEGDHYRSLRMSQGFGALGVGVLYDRGGDDVYEGESGVQGASSFGVGLLIDRDGDDQYVAYHAAQGFAYVRAVGVLYDATGDDVYFGHPSDVLYYSPQDASFNSSFVQGVGFGRRADGTRDGVFMSGGLGVLRDRAGIDHYTSGIFAQATGYWYGTGMLLEGGGDDVYDGVWYVQAGDAHFATSVLLEQGGNDDFNRLATRRNVAIGGGHDFSIAWFVDASGDDTYRAPGISFGSGNEGGAGIFADLAGTDHYDATGDNSFGHAAISMPGADALRQATGTVGIFLDADGIDTYARPTIGEVANDATWQQSAHTAENNERGVGLDRTGGRTGLE